MPLNLTFFNRPYFLNFFSKDNFLCLYDYSNPKLIKFDIKNNQYEIKELYSLGIHNIDFVHFDISKDIYLIFIKSKNLILLLDKNLIVINKVIFKFTSIFIKDNINVYLFSNDTKSIYKISNENNNISIIFSLSLKKIKEINEIISFSIEKNYIFLLDNFSSHVFKYNKLNNKYSIHLSFGREGHGKLRNPQFINIHKKKIYICDLDNYLVQKFNFNLDFENSIGGKGRQINQLDGPTNTYVNNNRLYICDKNNDRIIIYNVSSKTYQILIKRKKTNYNLSRPTGIDFDNNNNLLVSDRSNRSIKFFDKNFQFKQILKTNTLYQPNSISCVIKKNYNIIIVLDRIDYIKSNLIIYKFNKKNFFNKPFQIHKSKYKFKDPQGFDVDDNYIYVADTLNRDIVKISLTGKFIKKINYKNFSNNSKILMKSIICIDNYLYTADFDKFIIYKFDNKLNYIDKNILKINKQNHKVLRCFLPLNNGLLISTRAKKQLNFLNKNGKIIKSNDYNKETGTALNHPTELKKWLNKYYIVDKENDRIIVVDKNFNFINEIK